MCEGRIRDRGQKTGGAGTGAGRGGDRSRTANADKVRVSQRAVKGKRNFDPPPPPHNPRPTLRHSSAPLTHPHSTHLLPRRRHVTLTSASEQLNSTPERQLLAIEILIPDTTVLQPYSEELRWTRHCDHVR